MGARKGALEDMVVNAEFWTGRKVLVTGHTGFKGAWLCRWLEVMGAEVSGLSLAPEGRTLWDELELGSVRSRIGDIRDPSVIEAAVRDSEAEVVLHLAAQSLVRRSYREPAETFETNVMGTVHLLNAVRKVDSVRSVVVVTSDKCYRNDEDARAFTEDDPMGGHDPYSASKGAAEIATAAMRASFFRGGAAMEHPARVATARAGNVIGGGDYSEDRIVPDIIRGCLEGEGKVTIRSPRAIRPWQHVLEPLSGYLLLAEALFNRSHGADDAWNFGPDESQERPVIDLAEALVGRLGQGKILVDPAAADLHEAGVLRLNSRKARQLGWKPVLSFDRTVSLTGDWYLAHSGGARADRLCAEQIEEFCESGGR